MVTSKSPVLLAMIGPVILGGSIISCAFTCKSGMVPAHTHVGAHVNPQGEKVGKKKLFLWKIEPGNKRPGSFILGSVHFLKESFYPLAQTIERSFAQSSVLAVETYATPGERVSAAMAKGIYRAAQPQTLENQISAKTYSLVQDRLKTFGIDTGLFKKFKPWYLAQTISYM